MRATARPLLCRPPALEGRENCRMDCLTVAQPTTTGISDRLSGDQSAAELARQVLQRDGPPPWSENGFGQSDQSGDRRGHPHQTPAATMSPEPHSPSTTLANSSDHRKIRLRVARRVA